MSKRWHGPTSAQARPPASAAGGQPAGLLQSEPSPAACAASAACAAARLVLGGPRQTEANRRQWQRMEGGMTEGLAGDGGRPEREEWQTKVGGGPKPGLGWRRLVRGPKNLCNDREGRGKAERLAAAASSARSWASGRAREPERTAGAGRAHRRQRTAGRARLAATGRRPRALSLGATSRTENPSCGPQGAPLVVAALSSPSPVDALDSPAEFWGYLIDLVAGGWPRERALRPMGQPSPTCDTQSGLGQSHGHTQRQARKPSARSHTHTHKPQRLAQASLASPPDSGPGNLRRAARRLKSCLPPPCATQFSLPGPPCGRAAFGGAGRAHTLHSAGGQPTLPRAPPEPISSRVGGARLCGPRAAPVRLLQLASRKRPKLPTRRPCHTGPHHCHTARASETAI